MKTLTSFSLLILASAFFAFSVQAQEAIQSCPATDYELHCPNGQIRWKTDHMGCPYISECVDEYTHQECPQNHAPVCGIKNGVLETYRNICTARVDEASLYHEGPCETCYRLYRPVCAESQDGEEQTYINGCEAESHGSDILYEGECREALEVDKEASMQDWPKTPEEEVYNFWPTWPFHQNDTPKGVSLQHLNWQKYQSGLRERAFFKQFIRERIRWWQNR